MYSSWKLVTPGVLIVFSLMSVMKLLLYSHKGVFDELIWPSCIANDIVMRTYLKISQDTAYQEDQGKF